MSDEALPINDSAGVADAAPLAGSSATASASSAGGADGGFDTPYAAFKSLPDFRGQDDLEIAQNLYRSYNGYREAQRQLQQYQQVVPYANE